MAQTRHLPADDDRWMDQAIDGPTEEEIADFTRTPEFQNALAAAVEKALADRTQEIIDRITAQRGAPATTQEAGFARVLAGQIAELVDQDRVRRGQAARLPAEEIERRTHAAECMEVLLTDAFAKQKEPLYDVMKPCYFEEQLIDPTWQNPATKVLMRRQVTWYGVPNEQLSPANEVALAIYREFLVMIGGETRALNRPDLGRKKLTIVGSSDVANSSPEPVGTPRSIGMLKLKGDTVQGQISETRVLGTIAAPARQLA